MNNLVLLLKQRITQQRLKRLGVKVKPSHIILGGELLIEETGELRGARLIFAGTVKFGARGYIQSGEIGANTQIGRYCSLGRNVQVGFHPKTHPLDWASTNTRLFNYSPDDLKTPIGHDVWVGDDAKIFAGVTVGTGAIIGTSSIVTKDVEPYQIVGGCPAKPLKYRFEKTIIESLLESKCWEKDFYQLCKLDFSAVERFCSSANELPATTYPLWKIDTQSASKCP